MSPDTRVPQVVPSPTVDPVNVSSAPSLSRFRDVFVNLSAVDGVATDNDGAIIGCDHVPGLFHAWRRYASTASTRPFARLQKGGGVPPPQGRSLLVVAAPGGAYRTLSRQEGDSFTRRLLTTSIGSTGGATGNGSQMLSNVIAAAAALFYQFPPQSPDAPARDMERLVRVLKSPSCRRHLQIAGSDFAVVGIGFSAGGHLVGTYASRACRPVGALPVYSLAACQMTRLDAVAMLYPVVSMARNITHMVSRENLFRNAPKGSKDGDLEQAYSLERGERPALFPSDVFLFTTLRDTKVPHAHSVLLFDALVRHRAAGAAEEEARVALRPSSEVGSTESGAASGGVVPTGDIAAVVDSFSVGRRLRRAGGDNDASASLSVPHLLLTLEDSTHGWPRGQSSRLSQLVLLLTRRGQHAEWTRRSSSDREQMAWLSFLAEWLVAVSLKHTGGITNASH